MEGDEDKRRKDGRKTGRYERGRGKQRKNIIGWKGEDKYWR